MATINYTVKQLGVVGQYFPLLLFGMPRLPNGYTIPMSALPDKNVGPTVYGKYTVYQFTAVRFSDSNSCIIGHFYNFLN